LLHPKRLILHLTEYRGCMVPSPDSCVNFAASVLTLTAAWMTYRQVNLQNLSFKKNFLPRTMPTSAGLLKKPYSCTCGGAQG
jgi:hypothetical protein